MFERIMIGICSLVVLAIFVLFAMVLVPDGQKWLIDMMVSSTGFHPSYDPTLFFSNWGFLFWR